MSSRVDPLLKLGPDARHTDEGEGEVDELRKGFNHHGLILPFLHRTLHSGAEDLCFSVPHPSLKTLGLQVALVAPILIVGVFPTFTGDEAVLVGPNLVVAVEQGDDLVGLFFHDFSD